MGGWTNNLKNEMSWDGRLNATSLNAADAVFVNGVNLVDTYLPASASGSLTTYLPKAGGTMTGSLSLVYSSPTITMTGTGTAVVITNSDSDAGKLDVDRSLKLSRVGTGIQIKEGTNATMGLTGASAGGVVLVNTTAVTANSRIMFSPQTAVNGVTVGTAPSVFSRTAGASFIITNAGTNGASYAWMIVEPL